MRRVGLDCKLYYASTLLSDSNAPGDLTWTEVAHVEDSTLNYSHASDNIQSRGNNGFELATISLKQISIDFTLEYLRGQAGVEALIQAWKDSAEIALMALDGDVNTSGNEGVAANWVITDMPQTRNVTTHLTMDVTVEPGSQPQYYEVP